ncbi:conserved hypothetical protein [Alteracholeplasma palmae J233]|uniref:Uncharacterized protein n=1 Tax=Alteracholeplasma palmae (strain ATCC 49389 / J233) TaxID=1318466 RepID=U4KQX8_ALTPJ|nr:SatD family protein [Alteracholeplasma palmae]CCV63691.1 conserved hypothetical protein [Alteracholeplasma palmae J233]
MKNYYVLIIDVVKSRRLNDEDRLDVQKKLNEAINIVDRIFNDKIVKSLSFSAGDSIQGLFDTIETAYKAYLVVKNAVFPYMIRAGIGYGNVNQSIISEFSYKNSNVFDGEAYHLARFAIDQAKELKVNLYIKSNLEYDKMINPIIDDEKIIFMTSARKAIYSIINLVDPIIDNRYQLDDVYFEIISPLVTRIVNYYRSKSRVKGYFHDEYENRNQTKGLKELTKEETINYLKEYKDQYSFYNDKRNLMTINTPMRLLLVNLIGSKEQNINSLIRLSNMDYLRTRESAKISILNQLYGRE